MNFVNLFIFSERKRRNLKRNLKQISANFEAKFPRNLSEISANFQRKKSEKRKKFGGNLAENSRILREFFQAGMRASGKQKPEESESTET
jgi:hypothetical protein